MPVRDLLSSGIGIVAAQHRLAIDVGNTRVKLGLFACPNSRPRGELPTCVERTTLLSGEPLPSELLAHWQSAVTNWLPPIIAGSNPSGIQQLLAAWPSSLGPQPQTVANTDDFPLTIRVDEPRRVGIDRLLNAIAVNELRRSDRPAIIVDSGTATTVDVVSADGAFEGGAILPGLALSAKALHEYTALLPLVSVPELGQATPEPLGRNTRAAIRSGLFWGQLGAVKELIARQAERDVDIFVTGGGGALLANFLENAHLSRDPFFWIGKNDNGRRHSAHGQRPTAGPTTCG
ncbi:MAG: type III pantothenate kinase [Planctomycetota bacterium]|nr:MAG: type III pantothenate kinase [Planctomycetota bacterium]